MSNFWTVGVEQTPHMLQFPRLHILWVSSLSPWVAQTAWLPPNYVGNASSWLSSTALTVWTASPLLHSTSSITSLLATCTTQKNQPLLPCGQPRYLPAAHATLSCYLSQPVFILPPTFTVCRSYWINGYQSAPGVSGFLDPRQSDFHSGYCTKTVLVALVNDLPLEINKGNGALLILLDLLTALHRFIVKCW